jgi:Ca2+-binding EF-hand superfamily protein
LLKQNDANNNGVLEKDEWSRMRRINADADANKDNVISLQELANQLAAYASGSGSSAPASNSTTSNSSARPGTNGVAGRGSTNSRMVGNQRPGGPADQSKAAEKTERRPSYRFLSPTERLSESLPGNLREWFISTDRDDDGQIAMAEFSASWSPEKVQEFQKLDSNNDGRITPQEYVRVRSTSPSPRR